MSRPRCKNPKISRIGGRSSCDSRPSITHPLFAHTHSKMHTFVKNALSALALTSVASAASFPSIKDLVAFGDSYTDEGRRTCPKFWSCPVLRVTFSWLLHRAQRGRSSSWLRSTCGWLKIATLIARPAHIDDRAIPLPVVATYGPELWHKNPASRYVIIY
jgi:hypothetical protein